MIDIKIYRDSRHDSYDIKIGGKRLLDENDADWVVAWWTVEKSEIFELVSHLIGVLKDE